MKKLQPIIKGILILAVCAMTPLVHAADSQSFDPKAFEQAQDYGKTIVLDFHANWCPTCRKQEAVLKELYEEEGLKEIVSFTVDYDTSTALKKELNVKKQSTLIVFKGDQEVARQMGITNKDDIKSLIMKGL